MGRQQGVALQPREDRLVAGDAHVHQHHGQVRIADELLGDGEAALRVRGRDADRERVWVDVAEVVAEVALLLVDEALGVGEQQLHVAYLRAIDGRVVDLVQRAV